MQDQLKVLYMVLYGRTSSLLQYLCMMPTIITIRSYTTNATEDSSTRLEVCSRYTLSRICNLPNHFWIFGSAFKMALTVSAVESAKVTCYWNGKTAKGDTLRCPMYRWLTESLFVGIWEWYICRVWYWKPCCLAHIFRFLLVTWFLLCEYVEIKSRLLAISLYKRDIEMFLYSKMHTN